MAHPPPARRGTGRALVQQRRSAGRRGGAAVASLDGVEHHIAAGDAVIVPAGTLFSLANPHGEPFEAIVALPVGAVAYMGGEELVPPPAR